jgi:hypothetical protein
MECGSVSQPTASSFGTTSLRQVSASVPIILGHSRNYTEVVQASFSTSKFFLTDGLKLI